MVSLKKQFHYLDDGSIDLESWLNRIRDQCAFPNEQIIEPIQKAAQLAATSTKGLTTFYGQSCIEQSLEMAEILLELKLDSDAIVAAILMPAVQHPPEGLISVDTVRTHQGESVAKIMESILKMNALNQFQTNLQKSREQIQIDRLRKLFLAMVSDIRVVLIKLAERTCIMRGIKNINPAERKRIAAETMDIYAPLANRLGIGQLKWELEDVAFHYTNPDAYKTIAKFLAERRADREKRIHDTIDRLKEHLTHAGVKAKITGRAKHIYSIYLKTQRKDLDFSDIYDYSAIRLLVPSIEDCYTALSIVHQLFEHVPAEFDDYISNPKPNGYRSIHTAVIGSDGKNLEIQIRTTAMHEEAEHGVAAHWLYKEDKKHQSGYENKIAYLRQLLAWQKDIAQQNTKTENTLEEILEDRVYVFTPAGEVIDLPTGATPLDFAYHVHSEVGNRCRGAKIKGHIVPLTYQLQTGDQVEIITQANGTPSRDWLNKSFGYITTSRARAKISHWFKNQDSQHYIDAGRDILEKELSRASFHHTNMEKIAAQFDFKTEESLYSSIGHGNLRVAQIIHALQSKQPADTTIKTTALRTPTKTHPAISSGLQVAGVQDLLTRIARCCKPIPGDAIIGFITQGRGVSIHRTDCNNIKRYLDMQDNRILSVSWDSNKPGSYFVDLQIHALLRDNLLNEITNLLVNAKISLISLNTTTSRKNNMLAVTLTIQIHDTTQLKQLLIQISQLPKVIHVKRLSD